MPLTTTEVAIIGPGIAVLGAWWTSRTQRRREDVRRREDHQRDADRRHEEWARLDRRHFLDERMRAYADYGARVTQVSVSMRHLLKEGKLNDKIFGVSEALMKIDLIGTDDVRTAARRLWVLLSLLYAHDVDNFDPDGEGPPGGHAAEAERDKLNVAFQDQFMLYVEECRSRMV